MKLILQALWRTKAVFASIWAVLAVVIVVTRWTMTHEPLETLAMAGLLAAAIWIAMVLFVAIEPKITAKPPEPKP